MTNEVMVSAADRDFEQVGGSTSVVTYNLARTNGYQQGINNSSNEWYFTRYFPKSGTYRVKFVYWKTSDKGIIDIGLDDSTDNIFNGVDQYNGSALWNVESFSTIEVARGNHKITFKINGKHASSSGYFSDSILLQFDLIDEHDVLGEDAPSEDKPFWEEIGRFDLEGTSSAIRVPIKPKKYIKVMFYSIHTASLNSRMLFNNDTTGTDGSSGEYSYRINTDGGTDSTASGQNRTWMPLSTTASTAPTFHITDIVNVLNEEKLCITHMTDRNTAGAGTAPARAEIVTKWVAVDLIDEITLVTNTSTFADGTTVRVLGHD